MRLQTIGVAIMVASIFSYISGTSDFLEKITELLKSIVIDRNFLSNIDTDSKRTALESLIKPSEAEKQLYSAIDRYYDVFINHTLDITSKCVRSDYMLEARAYRDEEETVCVEQRISYRLHPTVKGYKDVTMRLDDKTLGSEYKWVRISDPKGNILLEKLPEPKEIEFGGNLSAICTLPLKELGKNSDHLKVQWCIVEKGHDHWIHLCFQALVPTDGFTYHVKCEDDLHVCAINHFIHGASFKIYKATSKELELSCQEWFNEGTGLALVISNNPPVENLQNR